MRFDRLSGLLPTLLALCFCLPPTASAMLTPRSGDVPLASAGHELLLSVPAVAVGADGAAVTVWTRNTAFNRGPVLSRRVEMDGTAGPEIQLSEDGEIGSNPGIIATEGGYVAYWTRDSSPGPWGTVVRFLDSSGGPADLARVVDKGFQGDTRITAVGDHLALVAKSSSDTGTEALRLRLIDRQGADMYPPRQLAAYYEEVYAQALASDGEGGVVVAWITSAWGVGDPKLKAQAFDAAGQPRSKAVVIPEGWAAASLHVAAGVGRFLVGWSEAPANGVELRVFSLAGERLGAPRLPRPKGPRDRMRFLTDLVATPQGAMVVWKTMDGDLFAAGLEWDWERTARSLSLPAHRDGEQLFGRVATNGNGDWAAAWKEISESSDPLVTNKARTFFDALGSSSGRWR
jgi:hypothetical protein